MQNIVFLGVFDKIANWIMSAVSKVLTWLVSNVIAPVCSFIWKNALQYVAELLKELVSVLLYKIYALILSILYALETAVYSFAGVKNVSFGGKQDNIVSLVFSQAPVKKAFCYITVIAVVLLFIFTVITVIKTSLDFGYDGKKNMGTIMTSFITSAVTFLILPVFCYGLVQLTSVCMNSLYAATSQSSTASVTDNLFILSIRSNVSDTAKDGIKQSELTNLTNNMAATPMYWRNLETVKPFIHKASNVDFVVGTIGAVILIVNLIIMSGTFIQRVMEITVLYIVSPLFVATMPLDDGERFNRWRRTFIGRLCMGVSMIIALNVVMMLISIIISGSDGYTIRFTSDVSVKENTVQSVVNDSVDIILKLIFMIGCIISVKNIGSLITGMIDEEAGSAERMSVHENTRRLVEAPEKIAKVAGAVMGFAGAGGGAAAGGAAGGAAQGGAAAGGSALGGGSAPGGFQDGNMAGGGFSGVKANASEQSFYDSVKKQNRINSTKAAFTARGAKYSALKEQTENGNTVLSQFSSLKTHEERAAFMQNFQQSGGVDSLKVDGSKFGSSDMTNMSERSALSNLKSRIDTARANRDRFEIGSDDYNKYNSKLKALTNMQKSFDSLNTHDERKAFIGAHKEFGDVASRNVSDRMTAVSLEKRANEAMTERDGFVKGSAAWQKADDRYQGILKKQAEFSSLSTREERDSFKSTNGNEISGESNALTNINRKIDQTEKARNSFEPGSEGWKRFDNRLNALSALSDSYNSLSSDEERNAFVENNEDAFGETESMDYASRKSLKNIDRKIASATKARDRFDKNSENWKKHNGKLNTLKMQREDFASLATNEERSAFAGDKSGFKDTSDKNESDAINILDAKKLTAVANRDMFEEGSKEWKSYNNKVKEYDDAASELLYLDSAEEKSAYIASNPIFKKAESTSFGNDRQRKLLTGNLDRAVQTRNRHKTGSAKWQQCNKEVTDLKRALATYDSLETRQERDEFVQKNSNVFDNSLSSDAGYNKIESSYKSWSALEKYAGTPELRKHAHKMAKSYADFSERYAAASPEEKRNILSQADSFGAQAAASIEEYSAIDSVTATGNEAAISSFVNANSHADRSAIVEKAARGEYGRYEIPTVNEVDYQSQLEAAAEHYSTMAEGAGDSGQKQSYEAMATYYEQAGKQYAGLSTHSRRESFASHVSAQISANGGTAPAMRPPRLNQRENEFAGKLSGDKKKQFSSLNTHRERYHYMADHYMNNNKLEMNEEEQQFYDNYLSAADTEYENTASYRAAYAAAPNHEARAQVMRDYSDYVGRAVETEMPGKWNYTPSISIPLSGSSASAGAGVSSSVNTSMSSSMSTSTSSSTSTRISHGDENAHGQDTAANASNNINTNSNNNNNNNNIGTNTNINTNTVDANNSADKAKTAADIRNSSMQRAKSQNSSAEDNTQPATNKGVFVQRNKNKSGGDDN